MTWPAYIFALTSILGWTLLLAAHRRHVRAMRAQAQDHRHAQRFAFYRGRWDGVRYTARQARAAKDWQEAQR